MLAVAFQRASSTSQDCHTPDQELTRTVRTLLSGVAAHFAVTVSMQAPVVKQRQPQVSIDTLWFGQRARICQPYMTSWVPTLNIGLNPTYM